MLDISYCCQLFSVLTYPVYSDVGNTCILLLWSQYFLIKEVKLVFYFLHYFLDEKWKLEYLSVLTVLDVW